MKKTGKILITLLQAALLINLSGCLPMSEAQINAKAQTIYQNLKEPVPAEEIEIQRELADEQVLRLSIRDIRYVDTNRMSVNDLTFMDQVFPGLTRKDPKSGEYLGALAKSWKVSKDLQTWTFELQPDIPWVIRNPETGEIAELHDENGDVEMVTAADVRAGLLNILNPENGSFQSYYLNTIVNAVEYASGEAQPEDVGIEAPSDTKLVIHTNQPNPYLDAIAALPIFSAIPNWTEPFILKEETVDVMLYYGPYVVTQYFSEAAIQLVSNPFWPGTEGLGKPVLTEIDYDLRNTVFPTDLYASGELDLVKSNYYEYDSIRQGSGLEEDAVTSPGSCGYYLFFKQIDSGLAASAETRRMITSAINKENLNKSLFYGTAQTLNHYVPAGVRGALPQDDDLGIAYDPEKAAEYFAALVAEEPLIEPLQIFTMDVSKNTAILETIAADLMNANVPVEVIVGEDWNEFADLLEEDDTSYNLLLTEYCMSYDDAQTLWDAWLDGSFTTKSENWQSEAFFKLMDASLKEGKTEKRAAKYAEMEAIAVVDDVVVIPLLWESDYWLRRPTVDGPLQMLTPHFEDWAIVK
ncbi:peptide ABC transporter substrate-binding protein [Pelolinea submarina]|uniref:ABC-type oligopeptide transport system substrate-binding subunit n=1 Tax=Pelolinea submarina TaxID=913107 RepID=A0A3E0AHZ3_9CHLR|nr:ABC transporter substrate-binding protein [Pelolinea submarina]REG11289.1 ABC-type oligopeptide transport system substrate-binding subunit [Pelolinea submarina]